MVLFSNTECRKAEKNTPRLEELHRNGTMFQYRPEAESGAEKKNLGVH